MSTNHHKREDPLVDMGYEVRDIDLPKLKKSVVMFFGFVAISAIIGWYTLAGFHFWIFQFAGLDPGYSKGESGYQNAPKLPKAPFPLLQTNATAKTDLMLMRQEDEGHLASTGYANKEKSKAFIPIDQAIDLLTQRGLPKPVSTPAKTKGTVDGKMNITSDISAEEAKKAMDAKEADAVKKYGPLGADGAATQEKAPATTAPTAPDGHVPTGEQH